MLFLAFGWIACWCFGCGIGSGGVSGVWFWLFWVCCGLVLLLVLFGWWGTELPGCLVRLICL